MGLLDDAIKEHLDLKRRSGADPTEVERLERDVLGPVRRGPQEHSDLPMEQPEAGDPVAYPDEAEAEHEWIDPPDEGQPAFDRFAEEPEREPARHHEIAEEWDSHEPLDLQEPPAAPRAHEALADERFPAEAPPASDALPPTQAPAEPDNLAEETAEYDIEAEELKKKPEGEDVLEETPEFLQDTPDHDRLWFEQRPPRDFDFDG